MADNVALSVELNGFFIAVLVEELVDEGRLGFTAAVEGADDGFADIRAILFDLENVDLTEGLSVNGDNVVGSQFTVDGVLNFGDGADFEGDGDTFRLVTPGFRETPIRLYGVVAPERTRPYGRESTRALAKMIAGEQVLVEVIDADRFGNLVAKVFLPDDYVNLSFLT